MSAGAEEGGAQGVPLGAVCGRSGFTGGEKYYIRKEYTEISQLGKEANTNASNEGSGISVDGASVDGGGEEGNEEV